MSSYITAEDRVRIVLLYAKYESWVMVRCQWSRQSPARTPGVVSMRRIFNKFMETDSIHNQERSDRSRSVVTEERIEQVREMLEVLLVRTF